MMILTSADYLHLLTDLDELGHLVLQFTVPLHQVGQVVLQSLLFEGRRRRNKANRGKKRETRKKKTFF